MHVAQVKAAFAFWLLNIDCELAVDTAAGIPIPFLDTEENPSLPDAMCIHGAGHGEACLPSAEIFGAQAPR